MGLFNFKKDKQKPIEPELIKYIKQTDNYTLEISVFNYEFIEL